MHHIKYFRSLFSLSRKPAKNRFQPNSALFTNSAESFSLAARFYFYYLGNEADLIPRLLLFASPGCGSFTRCTFRKPVQPILCVLPLRLNGGSGLTGARTVLQRRKFHRRSGKATEQPALPLALLNLPPRLRIMIESLEDNCAAHHPRVPLQ